MYSELWKPSSDNFLSKMVVGGHWKHKNNALIHNSKTLVPPVAGSDRRSDLLYPAHGYFCPRHLFPGQFGSSSPPCALDFQPQPLTLSPQPSTNGQTTITDVPSLPYRACRLSIPDVEVLPSDWIERFSSISNTVQIIILSCGKWF